MDLLIIKITQDSISRFEGKADKIYQAVHSAWRLNVNRAETVDYVLAAKEGKIVGVFKATKWHPCKERDGRYEFEGREAPKEIQALFKDVDLPEKFKKQGISNPIIYATDADFNLNENFDNENDAEKNDKSANSSPLPREKTCEIKAIITSIDFKKRRMEIKGIENFHIEIGDKDKEVWNVYVQEPSKEPILIKASEPVFDFGQNNNEEQTDDDENKTDEKKINSENLDHFWNLVVSNAFDSRRAYNFEVAIDNNTPPTVTLKSISLIED